ncbi:hypothetical protein [Bradyrhizobium sp. JYMT SZCCT0428]|uniref:hypothetical protein n=1 Tax=Bradyrhizobium sp. JYMT SZCCT0428 TaxID=2807673 RepID=UPI001BAC01F3|nr:hypothetical protein [Bradyrhizobium sp. JYMT SZCCT0428]MBR1154872.1 hypothetical protein [Bradyrhizobium sp. JYMT SZCCT0428]
MQMGVLREQSFPFAVVCEVLGVRIETFRSWLKNDIVHFSDDEIERKPNGHAHRLTYTTVVRVAIMVELMKFGMSPKTAWGAGFYYTVAGGMITDRPATTRLPGELFKHGITWLLVGSDGAATMVNTDGKQMTANIAVHIETSAIVICMNPFIERLNGKLSAVAEWSAA